MTVFITKVWGFSIPSWPLTFSTKGWRDNALEKLKEGDLVVVVGTTTGPTDPSERGRLLGIMEPTRQPVATLDFPITTRDVHCDDKGKFKWPHALHNRRAWVLDERPLLSDISDRRFVGMDSVLGIVPLTEEEAEGVLKLKRTEVELLMTVEAVALIEGDEVARRRASPPPATTRSGVMHMRRAPAYTYCMELTGANKIAYKIGWAFDFRSRQRQFNHAAMPMLGGISYEAKLMKLWDTAREAYRMEQALLDKFSANRNSQNHEIIELVQLNDIEKVWTDLTQRLRR